MLSFSPDKKREISENLDCGFRAFYHKQKREFIIVPDTERQFDMYTSAWKTELTQLRKNFTTYREIYAMERSDSFEVMANFAEQVSDKKLQEKLIKTLNRKPPFREFKFAIDNAGEYWQSWFNFKDKKYTEWTEEKLKLHNEPN